MAIYDYLGNTLSSAYNETGNHISAAYDISGNVVFDPSGVDYSNYSFTQKWSSKGISNTQGFAIYDGKVFWISKSGNNSIPAKCYVWNLEDGSQAFDTAYVTIQSGHGNGLSFDYPYAYATTAYNPPIAYVNSVSSDLKTFSLVKTLIFDADGSVSMDGCIDEQDSNLYWTVGHEGSAATENVFLISSWDISDLTQDGDYYVPGLINTVSTPIHDTYYRQGCAFHDGILWYASGYSGTSTKAYVYGIDPATGNTLYTIDCETTAEPEGIAWVQEPGIPGGHALYVGFQGMALRRYTFGRM